MKCTRKRQPMQPVVWADDGVIRFQANPIVSHLLDYCTNRCLSLNELCVMDWEQSDWDQFMQLIGYSVSGYGDLSTVSKASVKTADLAAELLIREREAKKKTKRKGA